MARKPSQSALDARIPKDYERPKNGFGAAEAHLLVRPEALHPWGRLHIFACRPGALKIHA